MWVAAISWWEQFMRNFILGALASIFAVGSANAAVVTWTLQDVAFADGGAASGTFDFDAATGAYSNIAITTTDGAARSGVSYGIPNPSSSGNADLLIAVTGSFADFTGVPELAMNWEAALTDLGGTVALNIAGFSFESDCVDATCAGVANNSDLRRFISGYVTTTPSVSDVPLPAALPLFLAGLAGIGAMRRKKNAAA